MKWFASVLSAAMILSAPARACDLALAFVVDISGSVDHIEYRIQMDGLAEALRDPVVSEALVRGQSRVMLVQWTSASRQHLSIPWTRIDSFATLDTLADRIAGIARPWRFYSTAIGEALGFALAAFPAEPLCRRRLIDLSGDGASNEGRPPPALHPELRAAGVVVNALAIEQSEPGLTEYYFENVITGEGAFVVTAASFADYPDRVRRKLRREVARQTADAGRPGSPAFR